jgi:hypothetical protein
MTTLSKSSQRSLSCFLRDDARRRNGRWSDTPVGLVRGTLVTLIVTAALSACANVEIGPVDHSCHVNPQRGRLDSGCGGGGGH